MECGLRYSKQREITLRVLQSTDTHPSAEWIYNEVKKQIPDVSLGTIYRNLKQLEEKGMIRKVLTSDNIEHYDADTSMHCHFICKKCGRILDCDAETEFRLKNESYDVEDVYVQFYGVCDKCKKG